MSAHFPWGVLGIAQTADKKAIRSAYAARLKVLDVDADVAAFSELRDAREEALYLAGQADQGDGLGPALGEEAFGDLPPADADWDAPLTADELLPQDTSADFGPAPDAEPAAADQPYDERPDRLLALLYPGGEHSNDPLSAADYAEAEALQRALIGEAQGAAIDKQHGIEMWLAHHLASAWPRSGPLVEESGAAFGWDRAAGQLDENAAVAFLNNRLGAIAFVHQLDDPAHWLHHEWVELKTPGRRGFNPLRKARVDKVQTLIASIRTNHPEVEEYLSPQKVQDWLEPASRGGGFNWTWVLGGIFLLSAIGRCADALPDSPGTGNPDIPPPALFAADWTEEQRRNLINEVLGSASDADLALLDQSQSPIWREMRIVTQYSPGTEQQALQALIDLVRNWSMIAADDAPFEQLVAAKQIKLELMQLARAQSGDDACVRVSRAEDMPPDVELSEELRGRERRLARMLLEAGRFDSQPPGASTRQADIPGNIYAAALSESGLDDARGAAAAMGQGSVADQCAMRIALSAAVLREPGNVSAELLKIL